VKQSIVKYKRTGDNQIKIVAFRNIATLHDVTKQCGVAAAKRYFSGAPTYEKGEGKRILVKTDVEAGYDVEVGSLMKAEDFQSLIATMKKAGNRLTKIRDEIDKEVVKEVII